LAVLWIVRAPPYLRADHVPLARPLQPPGPVKFTEKDPETAAAELNVPEMLVLPVMSNDFPTIGWGVKNVILSPTDESRPAVAWRMVILDLPSDGVPGRTRRHRAVLPIRPAARMLLSTPPTRYRQWTANPRLPDGHDAPAEAWVPQRRGAP
jgi:hypothetical protein